MPCSPTRTYLYISEQEEEELNANDPPRIIQADTLRGGDRNQKLIIHDIARTIIPWLGDRLDFFSAHRTTIRHHIQ